MNFAGKLKAGSLVILLVFGLTAFGSQDPRKFDEFGDINCESEMARLDNFAVQLQNEPAMKGIIVFYGGRRFRGRLPKHEVKPRRGQLG